MISAWRHGSAQAMEARPSQAPGQWILPWPGRAQAVHGFGSAVILRVDSVSFTKSIRCAGWAIQALFQAFKMLEKKPSLLSPEYRNLPPEQKALVKLELVLSHFVRTFEQSTARWERMIYPAMVVFALLGLSGFYLILNVTRDMHILAQNMDPMMADHMQTMTHQITNMSKNMTVMQGDIEMLVKHISNMEHSFEKVNNNMDHISKRLDTLEPILENINQMNTALGAMTGNTAVMSRDMNTMNRNISRPLSIMNSMTPW